MLILLFGLGIFLFLINCIHIYLYFRDAVSYHDTDQNSIISVYANMSEELQRLFPETLIIPVLG